MVDVDIEDLIEIDDAKLIEMLQRSSDRVQLRVHVDNLYQASSNTELADNWLKLWYFGERLAESAQAVNVYFRQINDRGAGMVVFNFKGVEVQGMASTLSDLIPAFDPDGDEAPVFIFDEALDWLEKRGDVPARFPELEESFRDDAAQCEDYGRPVFDDESDENLTDED